MHAHRCSKAREGCRGHALRCKPSPCSGHPRVAGSGVPPPRGCEESGTGCCGAAEAYGQLSASLLRRIVNDPRSRAAIAQHRRTAHYTRVWTSAGQFQEDAQVQGSKPGQATATHQFTIRSDDVNTQGCHARGCLGIRLRHVAGGTRPHGCWRATISTYIAHTLSSCAHRPLSRLTGVCAPTTDAGGRSAG